MLHSYVSPSLACLRVCAVTGTCVPAGLVLTQVLPVKVSGAPSCWRLPGWRGTAPLHTQYRRQDCSQAPPPHHRRQVAPRAPQSGCCTAVQYICTLQVTVQQDWPACLSVCHNSMSPVSRVGVSPTTPTHRDTQHRTSLGRGNQSLDSAVRFIQGLCDGWCQLDSPRYRELPASCSKQCLFGVQLTVNS